MFEARSTEGMRRRGFARSSWLWALALLCLACGASRAQAPEPARDFPPLQPPGTRALPQPDAPLTPPIVLPEIPRTPSVETASDSAFVYRLGVDDELQVRVLGQPDLSVASLRVLPDGSVHYPGCGTLWAQGRTVDEVTGELKVCLSRLLRYPEVQAMVLTFGAQRVYVMGEVTIPQDHEYRKGITALQAIAQAGGFLSSARRQHVAVFRRTGPESSEVFQLDLSEAFREGARMQDLPLRPYDIVYVPKTTIANWNVFVDQFFRQNISPFTFYLEGWNAFNVERNNAILRTR